MKVISRTSVPTNDEESGGTLIVINVENLEALNEFQEDFKNNYLAFKEEIMNFLGVGEEYNVMPGAIYHRYDVTILNNLILVYETSAYNI